MRRLVDDALIEEHRTAPNTAYSDALERVLRYFRGSPVAGKHVIFKFGDPPVWRIGVLSGERGERPRLLSERVYTSEEDAQHGVFCLRVAELRGQAGLVSAEEVPTPSRVITGYADELSVSGGSRIRFFVNAEGAESFRATLVRHKRPDVAEAVNSPVNGRYPARAQPIHAGSCATVADRDGVLVGGRAWSLHAFVSPTTPTKGRQGILTRWCGHGAALGLGHEGKLTLWLAGPDGQAVTLELPEPLEGRVWYSVGCAYDADAGTALLHSRRVVSSSNSAASPLVESGQTEHAEFAVAGDLDPGGAVREKRPFLMAAFGGLELAPTSGHYNGKLESPRVYDRALDRNELDLLSTGADVIDGLVAHWDFSREIGRDGVGSAISDRSGRFPGTCVNMPARAVTGRNWSGEVLDYRFAPSEYGAIHFHDDDLEDAAWTSDCALTVPDELASGLYALRLSTDEGRDEIPFFVRPPRGRPGSRVAFLAPTATYLAYANQMPMFDRTDLQSGSGKTPVLGVDDLFLYDHPEYGLSTYDRHSDGGGIVYSSRLRPILDLRPAPEAAGKLWGLSADMCLIGWLDAKGIEADFVTDHDLDREGVELLRPYDVVLTGSHPEYYSRRMLDGVEEYLQDGGSLMYLGGNGLYWVISFDPERPHVLEVRKQSGTRAWECAPGEGHHSSTGEPGGLWRNRARPPQKLLGVGFSAQGFADSSYFRRAEGGLAAETAFIFDGVRPDEPIGAFGLAGGGAAGLELDRYDRALGTPTTAFLLASSEGHTDNYLHVVEEIEVMRPGLGGSEDPAVRADMTFFRTAAGGAVFSTGSIAWCESLPVDGYDNNVSRITHNVLCGLLPDDLPIRNEDT